MLKRFKMVSLWRSSSKRPLRKCQDLIKDQNRRSQLLLYWASLKSGVASSLRTRVISVTYEIVFKASIIFGRGGGLVNAPLKERGSRRQIGVQKNYRLVVLLLACRKHSSNVSILRSD
jgi:hypothetical protein